MAKDVTFKEFTVYDSTANHQASINIDEITMVSPAPQNTTTVEFVTGTRITIMQPYADVMVILNGGK